MPIMKVDKGFWWWSDDYDIQSAKILGDNGEKLCRVEVHSSEER